MQASALPPRQVAELTRRRRDKKLRELSDAERASHQKHCTAKQESITQDETTPAQVAAAHTLQPCADSKALHEPDDFLERKRRRLERFSGPPVAGRGEAANNSQEAKNPQNPQQVRPKFAELAVCRNDGVPSLNPREETMLKFLLRRKRKGPDQLNAAQEAALSGLLSKRAKIKH